LAIFCGHYSGESNVAELYKGKVPIIRRSLNEGWMRGDAPADIATGCIPRDYAVDPVLMRDSPATMTVYKESEWDALYDEQEATESSLEHIFLRGDKPAFVNLDQGPDGYCWAYSTGHAMMLDRLKQNLPLVRINPHATAAIIKRGRDEGGWCGLSMKWAREYGYAVEGTGPGEWPLHSRNLKYDTPALRAAMALHKAEEDWYDLGKQEWEQKESRLQLATCGFNNNPTPSDFNVFGHSMCQVRWVRVERGHWGQLILNSWVGFGYYGLCVIPETTTRVDNGVSLRASSPSAR
jgi:hypothetical protein